MALLKAHHRVARNNEFVRGIRKDPGMIALFSIGFLQASSLTVPLIGLNYNGSVRNVTYHVTIDVASGRHIDDIGFQVFTLQKEKDIRISHQL